MTPKSMKQIQWDRIEGLQTALDEAQRRVRILEHDIVGWAEEVARLRHALLKAQGEQEPTCEPS